MTERIKLLNLFKKKNIKKNFIEISDKIKNGAVFIYPTETIYGIGGRADIIDVEKRIRLIKGRKEKNPFIIISSNQESFNKFNIKFTKKAKRLAEKYWPGYLTLVLPINNKENYIGIRVSNHPFIIELNKYLNIPIFSTSANLSGKPYINDPDLIYNVFSDKVDFMIDAGPLPTSKPSTVVKVKLDESVEILREGIISKEEIYEIVNKI